MARPSPPPETLDDPRAGSTPAEPASVAPVLPQTRSARDSRSAPRVLPRHPFYFVYHPDRFGVVGGEVVPLLEEFALGHGINGCLVEKDGAILTDEAEQNILRSGMKFLPWDVDTEGGPYIREAAPGVWVSRWTGLVPGSDRVTTDLPGYVRWIKRMQAKGHLPRPERHHLEKLAGRTREDMMASARGEDTYRVAQLQAVLDVIERNLAELDAPAESSEPTKLPARRKGAARAE